MDLGPALNGARQAKVSLTICNEIVDRRKINPRAAELAFESGRPSPPARWPPSSPASGHQAGSSLVGRMLHHLGYSLQANAKVTEGAQHPDRDARRRLPGERQQPQQLHALGRTDRQRQPRQPRRHDKLQAPSSKLDSVRRGADHLRAMGSSVYGVTLTAASSGEDIKVVALAYNRGDIYQRAGAGVDVSPNVMNQFDAAHTDMAWPQITGEPLAGRTEYNRYDPVQPRARRPVTGSSQPNAGGCGRRYDHGIGSPKSSPNTEFPPGFPQVIRPVETHLETTKGERRIAKVQVT